MPSWSGSPVTPKPLRGEGGSRPARAIELTAIGGQVRRLPLASAPGAYARAADGARSIARACALLSERHLLPPRTASTTSDLLSAIDAGIHSAARPASGGRTRSFHLARKLRASYRNPPKPNPRRRERYTSTTVPSRGAVRYPDRVAQRREPGSPNVLLASGTGATIARESGVRDGEFLVALDVRRSESAIHNQSAIRHPQSGLRGPQAALSVPKGALIRLASLVERDWLAPTSADVVHRFDEDSGSVKAVAVDRYDALVLRERPVAVDPEVGARLLAEAWLARGPSEDDRRLLRRLKFAGHDIDVRQRGSNRRVWHQAARRHRSHARAGAGCPPRLGTRRPRSARGAERAATTGSSTTRMGRSARAVKLQELFGLAETPRIGQRREPVVLSLLAPNGRRCR
jgi:ATP-dependent helicase HrpB